MWNSLIVNGISRRQGGVHVEGDDQFDPQVPIAECIYLSVICVSTYVLFQGSHMSGKGQENKSLRVRKKSGNLAIL